MSAFGDPECEVLMPLLKSPAGELFLNASTGKLKELDIEFDDGICVGVYGKQRLSILS